MRGNYLTVTKISGYAAVISLTEGKHDTANTTQPQSSQKYRFFKMAKKSKMKLLLVSWSTAVKVVITIFLTRKTRVMRGSDHI